MILHNLLPQQGQILGRKYRVEGNIGAGGMGSVFMAVDQTLGRQVAVKVLDPNLANDPDTLARFEREARVARHLSHPNTIQIFDFGRLDSGLPYIVMEYLRGTPLDKMINTQGALGVDRTVHIATQILYSLCEAHANSVIHRDLKPANVIVGEFGGEEDFVKVLDFGIAKILDSDRESGALKTRSGLVIGSPAYMAPERIKAQDLTPGTDLYSLGMLMVECLTGRELYPNMTPIEILASHLANQPLPIPDALRNQAIGRILIRATDRDLNLRYKTSQEMLADLDNLGNQQAPMHGDMPYLSLATDETVKMDASMMDLSKPFARRKSPKAAKVKRQKKGGGIWSNPLNVVLAALIVLLIVATLVVVVLTV